MVLLLAITGISNSIAAQTADMMIVNKIRSNANQPGSIAFVNLSSGKVIRTVPVGNEPHEVAVSDDKRFAVVTNTGSYKEPGNSLSVIDIAAGNEIHRVDLGPLWNPHGIIFSRGLFYFTGEGARAIGAYNPETNQVVWINGTGQDATHMLVRTRNGKFIITTNRGSGTISIFEFTGSNPIFPGAWKETIIPVGKSPEGLQISPDSLHVWVGLRGGNEIVIANLAEKRVTDRFSTNEYGVARVKFTDDGKYLLATDPRKGELIFIDVASHQIVRTMHMGEGCEPIFIEPDGRHILVGVTNEDNVTEVDLQTMSVTRKFYAGKGPDTMVWIGE